MQGLLDVLQGASNSAAGAVSVPVDGLAWLLRKAGVPIPEQPVGGSDWMAARGLLAEPQSRGAGLLGETLGLVAPIGAAAKAPQLARGLLALGENRGSSIGSRQVKINDPPPAPQRAFSDDYPNASGQGAPGSRIETDIDGNPLGASLVAGRRRWQGPDEAVTAQDAAHAARELGISSREVRAADIGGDAGRFVRSSTPEGDVTREIRVRKRLGDADKGRVFQHEFGHALDSMAYGRKLDIDDMALGAKLTPALVRAELSKVYDDLNRVMRGGKGLHTPHMDGYRGADIDAELIAEGLRAYQAAPEYFKGAAPNAARALRLTLNRNKNINQVIQFNAAPVGLLGAGLFGNEPGD